MADGERYDATVIIAARNAGSTIDQQLEALAHQRTDVKWELVVVDNGSEDDTSDVVRRWAGSIPNLRIIDHAPPGAAGARNAGANAAVSEFLLFCDADDIVEPDWLDELVAAVRDADAAAGTLEVAALNDASVVAWYDSFSASGVVRSPNTLPWARTANLAVRREVFQGIGGFDESFAGAAGEDIAFAWSVQLAGHSLVDAPNAVIHYRLRTDVRSVVRQARRYGEAEVLLHRRFGDRGMRRRTVALATKSWAWHLVHLPQAVGRRDSMVRWRRGMAKNVGRVIGSIRYRHFYP